MALGVVYLYVFQRKLWIVFIFVIILEKLKPVNLCLHMIPMQRRKVSEELPGNPTDSLARATFADCSTNKGMWHVQIFSPFVV